MAFDCCSMCEYTPVVVVSVGASGLLVVDAEFVALAAELVVAVELAVPDAEDRVGEDEP